MKKYLCSVVSNGIAIGEALIIPSNGSNIDNNFYSLFDEKNKLDDAIEKSIIELETLYSKKSESFIQAHILLLKDITLKREIYDYIDKNKKSAAEAFSVILDKYINATANANSSYLKDRYLDFKDIKDRVLKNMNTIKNKNSSYKNTILVIDELIPSCILEYKETLRGVVSSSGGFVSHGAILLRSFGIPYVVLPGFKAYNGMQLIIDTTKGILIESPSYYYLNKYKKMLLDISDENNIVDRKKYNILANISSNEEIENIKKSGFCGVGLYRTEFIFMNYTHPLTENEQYEIYLEAIKKMKDKSICFRTFDTAIDKAIPFVKITRGIECYKENSLLFESQVRAIIRANIYNNAKIMFPMIKSNKEFNELREWVLKIKSDMNNSSIIKIGMMLETKEALDEISKFNKPDFICIGTNDLTCDLYQINRNDEIDYNNYLNRLVDELKSVISFTSLNDIPLTICGELAAVPEATKLFTKMGLKSFSVSNGNLKILLNSLSNK